MATLSASRRNSNTSNSNSPRPSLANITKLLSLDEEDSKKDEEDNQEQQEDHIEETTATSNIKPETKEDQIKTDEICRVLSDLTINKRKENKKISFEDEDIQQLTQKLEEVDRSSPATEKIKETQSTVSEFAKQLYNKLLNNLEDELDDNSNRNRACSERSDSGISDCSIVASSLGSTLLRDKNLSINEDEIKEFESNMKNKEISLDNKGIKNGKLNINNESGE